MMEIAEHKEHQLESLDKVKRLQEIMLSMPQTEIQSWFNQGGGIAAKMVFFPAGVTVVGSMHRHENMNIMVCGDMTITTDGEAKRITVTDAPLFIVSPPGTKRAAHVHADTYWISLHPTDEKEIEEVEKRFIVEEQNEAEFLKLLGS